jgi:hypothetical protein
MASRNWLSWLMGWILLVGTSFMQAAHGQEDYGYGGGYNGAAANGSPYGGTGYVDDGRSVGYAPANPYAATNPYDYPVPVGAGDNYVAAPTPQSPMIFSQIDPFKSAFRSYEGFFFRTEYLLWDYTRPGDVLLGAQQSNLVDPHDPFDVFDTSTNPSTLLGQASVPNLDQFKLRNNSGVRGTVGIPLIFGSMETSIFSMGTAQDNFLDTTLLGTAADPLTGKPGQPFAATTTSVNGALGDNVLLYNDSFKAVFTSKVWGGDSNIYFNGPSSQFFSFSPMVGFKYFDLRESLQQQGSFTPDPIFGLPKVVTDIYSASSNQIYAPQIGLRTKFENSWMAVTFDPKVGLGANVYKNRVYTNHLRSNADPFTQTIDSSSNICPTVDLGLNGRIKVSDRISLTGGYQFMFIGRVTRPQDNINYNDNGAANPPGIVVDTHKSDFIVQGITVGIELRAP